MKHLKLYLSICWICWFSQIFAISTICGLSDIPAPPILTLGKNVSDLVSETLSDTENSNISLTNVDVKSSNKLNINGHQKYNKNNFIVLPEIKKSVEQETLLENISTNNYNDELDNSENLFESVNTQHDKSKDDNIDKNVDSLLSNDVKSSPPSKDTEFSSEVNLTSQENPIPVFSEWAQKRMEEAEKKMEKQVANSSFSKKNTTTGNKFTQVKLRAKNYASPDCGAKIIASNVEAQNTGALLTSSKDEYMLSPCTSRIWFVIELCEAIQLEKVDLANFELFSSSPKNFSVAVSNRFPTREWSNVGKFVAEDNRNIQSFSLHPHIFGKFLRVDVYSHYNSEHFCPISLFHVYGTSEFEAFETENRHPNDDLDEYEDDFSNDQQQKQQQKNLSTENNLFKSASDAVISIVKKAAEVLVKTNSNNTKTGQDITNFTSLDDKRFQCFTPKINFVCDKCNQSVVASVNYLLSCRHVQLANLLRNQKLRKDIQWLHDHVFIMQNSKLVKFNSKYSMEKEQIKTANFLLNILPAHYIMALCHLSGVSGSKDLNRGLGNSVVNDAHYLFVNLTSSKTVKTEPVDNTDRLIDDSFQNENIHTKQKWEEPSIIIKKLLDKEKMEDGKTSDIGIIEDLSAVIINKGKGRKNKSSLVVESEAINNLSEGDSLPLENVNIFNVVEEKVVNLNTSQQIGVTKDSDIHKNDELSTEVNLSSANNVSKDVEIEQGTWDSIDKLLAESESSSDDLSSSNNEGETFESQIPQRVQTESIYIRLSNRIKALERNMSLSGQYLEELSRRYKKQVEELQYSFSKTLTAIQEQNRNAIEKEDIISQRNKILEQTVNDISFRLNSYISLIACLGFIVICQLLISCYFIRLYRHQRFDLLQHYGQNSLVSKRLTSKTKKLNRRRSVESVIVRKPSSSMIRTRRPSEEAMSISGSYKDLLLSENDGSDEAAAATITTTTTTINDISKYSVKKKTPRQRKTSIFGDAVKNSNQSTTLVKNSSLNSSTLQNEKLLLDEDYESYIPGTDLAYNEFMPEGPSGRQSKVLSSSNNNRLFDGSDITKQKKNGKVRKLSSSKFLKSFSKHDNNKKFPHGPTGWEWYRSKTSSEIETLHNSEPNKNQQNCNLASIGNYEKVNDYGQPLNTKFSISEAIRITNGEKSDDSYLNSGSNLKKNNSFRRILKKVF